MKVLTLIYKFSMEGKHPSKPASMLPYLLMDPMSIASILTVDSVTSEGIISNQLLLLILMTVIPKENK